MANQAQKDDVAAGRTPLQPGATSTQIWSQPQVTDLEPAAHQAMFEFDPRARQIVWSDASSASRLLGPTLGVGSLSLEDYEAAIIDDIPASRRAAFAATSGDYSCTYRITTEHGDPAWFEERGGWISVAGEPRLIGVLRSIEGERRHVEALHHQAYHDDLTGTLNRSQLRVALAQAMQRMDVEAGSGAYLLAGIDDLGAINADFGFDAADEVIKEVARRIEETLPANTAAGRIAGTKFGIVVSNASEEEVRQICIDLLNAVRQDVVDTSKGAVATSICLGAIHLPDEVENANGIMGNAEAALDQAKRLGRSSWSAFSEKTDIVTMRRRNSHMSDVILTALNERRVRLAFQPIVNDLGETPTKFECLIRMRADDGSEVPAPDFIPAAERLGLVHLLDRRVLELAINTLTVCPNVKMNVNVSMETVKDPVWAEGYLGLLRNYEALARRITVELTETQVIDAIDASIEFVSELKKVGSSFAIDDFGAGYTSFRNLKALDIDILKIDGSFVTGVASSRENQLFVRTLLDLARNFGMQTVAEWVDNEADAMLLKGLGVDYLQGFLIGRPETNPAWLPDGAPNEPPAALR
ncbi:MAG: EAL domain-containing protein [Pseudomonadota bacterium]